MWGFMFIVECNFCLLLYPIYIGQENVIYAQLTLFVLTALFHSIAMCRNPGYIKKPIEVSFMQMLEKFNPVLLCPDCEIVRTDRSRHCSICNKCVERFDHHCPWINNCVGLDNHNPFMIFLLCMFTTLIMTIVIVCSNFTAIKTFGTVTKYSFPHLLPIEIIYDKTPSWVAETVFYFCSCVNLTIATFFSLPVMALMYFQLRNYCHGRTTNEVFSKSSGANNRTSTYLLNNEEEGEQDTNTSVTTSD